VSDQGDVAGKRIGELLAEAGLTEILPGDFSLRVKEAKRALMGRLYELLQLRSNDLESRSVAHSIGTLRHVERTLGGEPPASATVPDQKS